MIRTLLAVLVVVLYVAGASRAQCQPTWETRTSAVVPPVVLPAQGGFAYHSQRQRVVYCTGRAFWEWDGNVWTFLTQWSGNATNTPDEAGLLSYDSARNRLVFLVRASGQPIAPKTWEWDGTAWELKATFGPPQVGDSRLFYVPSTGTTLLINYGGNAVTTWEWSGSFWVQVSNSGPSTMVDACYDSARNRVVMLGTTGIECGSTTLGTWEWNPIARTWSLASVTGPTAASVLLYYDAARARTIALESTLLAYTWEWDGTEWTLLGRRSDDCLGAGIAATYDTSRSRAVVLRNNGPNQWYPREASTVLPVAITSQPLPQTRNAGQSAGFTITAQGSGTLAYQWRRNGQPLANGANVAGAQSPALTLSGLSLADTGAIDCVVSNACGSVTSSPTVLVVNPACRADVDNGSGAGAPDGGVNIDDLLYFLLKFEEGC